MPHAVFETTIILTCLRNVETGKNENLYARVTSKIVSVHQNAVDARRIADLKTRTEESGFTFPLSSDEGQRHIEVMKRTEVHYEVIEIVPGAEMYIETDG
jgi:hypothetical protein